MTQFFVRFVPFIFLGMAIVGLIFGLILFLYLLALGVIVGSVLFLISWVRERFFQPKTLTTRSKKGRTIDHQ